MSLDFYPPSGQTSTDPTLAPNHAINQWGAQPYYPGDDVVDWMCADGYNWAPNKPGTRYESFQELFQAFYNWAVPHNKPLMVGETGVQELQPGDKAKWLTAMHVSLTQHYPNIVAFLYFDTQNANGLANEWWLESSPDAYQAWKDMAADPYFNHKNTLEAPYGNGAGPAGAGGDTTTTTAPPGTTPTTTLPGQTGGSRTTPPPPAATGCSAPTARSTPSASAKATSATPPGRASPAVDLEPTPVGRRLLDRRRRRRGLRLRRRPPLSATLDRGRLAAGRAGHQPVGHADRQGLLDLHQPGPGPSPSATPPSSATCRP